MRVVACLAAAAAGAARAAEVLVMASGSAALDQALVAALEGEGHEVTVGQQWFEFDGSDLAGAPHAVLLMNSVNWMVAGGMPVEGQRALLAYVSAGGGLATTEWTIRNNGAGGDLDFAVLEPAFAVEPTVTHRSATAVSYSQTAGDDILWADLPSTFSFPVGDLGGSETFLVQREGARTYYASDYSISSFPAVGLAGWRYGTGRVANLSVVVVEASLGDAEFVRLLGNVMDWLAVDLCAADWDGDGFPTVNDLLAYLGTFRDREPSADIDGDGNVGVNDLLSYLGGFRAGC